MSDLDSPEPARPDGEPPVSGEAETQRHTLGRAVRHSALPVNELWVRYFTMGGTAGEYEIDAYINASYALPALERDILAQATNEMVDSLPSPPRASYSTDLPDDGAAPPHQSQE